MNKHSKPLVAAAIVGVGFVALLLQQRSSPEDGIAASTCAPAGSGSASSADPDRASSPRPPPVQLAMMARDPSLCNHRPPTPPARSKLCHDEYHFFLSLKDHVDHCDGIEQKMLADACRMLVSGENRCRELVPEQTIDGLHKPSDIQLVCESCFGNLAACDSVKDEHDRGLCTFMHYLVKAAKAKDPRICERIVNEDDNKSLCLFVAER